MAGWSPATLFEWDSSTGIFLWILLSFTEHLFAEHLWKAVSVVFSQVLLFPMWRVVRQWRPKTQWLCKTPLNSMWCGA